MACYDCEWCEKEKTCKYSYWKSDCYANEIENSKAIVSHPLFNDFFEYVNTMYDNDEYYSEALSSLNNALEICKSLSEEE